VTDAQLFAAKHAPGSHLTKVYCTVCGADGYPYGDWMEAHRRGHLPCPRCGKLLAVLKNGAPRVHGRCPKKVPDDG